MKWPTVFTLLFIAVCLSVAVSKVVNILLLRSLLNASQVIPVIQYLPFFLLFFMEKNINRKMAVVLMAICFAWYFISISFKDEFKLAMNLGEVFAVMAMCLALFFTFRNLKIKVSKTITVLSNLALPFYLTHLPILIFLDGYGVKTVSQGIPFYF
ncbi:MAG: hypothetical protein QRY16_17760 [Enterobacterales bacterium endosymbiont of Blomia tropicalis]|uniref:hypothetical protein n=1 Tax=Mixta mediterraneensis TaxID=2758443 RepID=UPI0025A8E9AD|nr:hypothetical protein [Mixta mediterraneensis]MDL4915546.1 hypothetical protein [Mixta mediterraneensis]